MPVDRNRKFIFVHIPKVAGTSIERLLDIYHEDKDVNTDIVFGSLKIDDVIYSLQHTSIAQLKHFGFLSDKEVKNFYAFTFVRNPWDRAVSDYKWQKNIRKQKLSFRNYLKRANQHVLEASKNRMINALNCHYVPQSWFVFEQDGKMAVDFLGRYENLNNDIDQLQKNLGLPSKQLRNDNKGQSTPYYFYYWDVRNIFLIRKLYSEDIKNFKYSFFKSNALTLLKKRILDKIKQIFL